MHGNSNIIFFPKLKTVVVFCMDGWWMGLVQGRVQSQNLLFVVLTLYRVLSLLYISQGLPLLTRGFLQYTTLTLCLHVVTITLIIC